MKGVVVTVRVDWPEPPGDSETLEGFRVVMIVGSLGFTELDSWTVPEKPVLPRVMVDDPELPAETKKDVGDALIEKSGAAWTAGSNRNAAITSPRYTSLRIVCQLPISHVGPNRVIGQLGTVPTPRVLERLEMANLFIRSLQKWASRDTREIRDQ